MFAFWPGRLVAEGSALEYSLLELLVVEISLALL